MTQNIGIEILRAKNRHRIRTIVYSIIAIGNIFISIPLIKAAGAIGAATGTAIALVVGNVCFMNWYYAKYIKLDIAGFWRNLGKIGLALIIPVCAGFLMTTYWNMDNIVIWILSIVIYIIVYLAALYIVAMNRQEKANVRSLLWRKHESK